MAHGDARDGTTRPSPRSFARHGHDHDHDQPRSRAPEGTPNGPRAELRARRGRRARHCISTASAASRATCSSPRCSTSACPAIPIDRALGGAAHGSASRSAPRTAMVSSVAATRFHVGSPKRSPIVATARSARCSNPRSSSTACAARAGRLSCARRRRGARPPHLGRRRALPRGRRRRRHRRHRRRERGPGVARRARHLRAAPDGARLHPRGPRGAPAPRPRGGGDPPGRADEAAAVDVELVTPTGACLVKANASGVHPLALDAPGRDGLRRGHPDDLPDRPNMLRVVLGDVDERR
jgi:hypothetical protein